MEGGEVEIVVMEFGGKKKVRVRLRVRMAIRGVAGNWG